MGSIRNVDLLDEPIAILKVIVLAFTIKLRRYFAPKNGVWIECVNRSLQRLSDPNIRKLDALLIIARLVLELGRVVADFVERPVTVKRCVD